MQKGFNRRAVLGLAVFAITAASYAQWSNPADDVPAYHPSAPLKVSALPPILAGAQLTGENFRYPWQVHVYQQAAKIGNVLYQFPATAVATARWATPACAVAMRIRTAPSAPPAPRRFSSPTGRPGRARPRRRSAPPSPATSTRASTWRSSRPFSGKIGMGVESN